MNNNYEISEAECVGFSRSLRTKLTFLVIGGGIGAAVALLFAPKPGRELREDITDLAGKGYDKALTTANEMKDRTAEFYETAKETGDEVLDVVSTGMSAIKDEVSSDVEKIGDIVGGLARRSFGFGSPNIL